MKHLSGQIKYFLLLTFMVCSGGAMAQDKMLIIEKGAWTFEAASNADYYNWYVDSMLQDGVHNEKFTNNWEVGTSYLSAVPFKDGCEGEMYTVQLIIKDDLIKGDTQLVFTSESPLLVCPVSNVNPNASTTIIEVELRAYNDVMNPENFVLVEGQKYVIKYSIDNGNPVSKELESGKAFFELDIKELNPGTHHLKLLKLSYGEGYRRQVDYTKSKNQPAIKLKVKPKPLIDEIEIIEED